jgi:hypothetical protein
MYYFLVKIKIESITVNVSMKCVNTTPLALEYHTKNDAGKDTFESSVNTIIASQFFTNVSFDIYDFSEIKDLKLHLGDTINTFFIENVTIFKTHFTKKDTLYTWVGADNLSNLTIDSTSAIIADQTPRYLQLEIGEGHKFLNLNTRKYIEIFRSCNNSKKHLLARAIVSFCFAIFIAISIYYRPKSSNKSSTFEYKKTNKLFLSFMAIIFLVFLNTIFRIIPDFSNTENRKLSLFPDLSTNNIFTFPDKLSNFLQEHFAFRNLFFFSNSYLHAKIFNISAMPQNVIMGKDGWMFYNDNSSISDFRRTSMIDTNMSKVFEAVFIKRMLWLQQKYSCKFYIFVPPNKERIYPDFMPSSYFAKDGFGHNSLDYYKQLFERNGVIKIIDPSDSLLEARKRRDVYYSTDTHWNLYGGFKGYQKLMLEIQKDFPAIHVFHENEFIISDTLSTEGDLSGMLNLNKVYKRKEYNLTFIDTSRKLYNNKDFGIVLNFATNDIEHCNHLKLLMFRDSYTNYLIPFLSTQFEKSTYVWDNIFRADLIDKEKPNIVIFESLQRFLFYALSMPNPTMVNKDMDSMSTHQNSY